MQISRDATPQAADDSAVTEEDTPVAINALANDTDASLGGFQPVIVTGPQHGRVAVNTDGTFLYTPAANYFGDDSFTYQLSNGTLNSHLARVSIKVTPVNDAPGVNPVTTELNEDKAAALNLLAAASDADGDTLTVTALQPPQHGRIEQNASGVYVYTPDANFFGVEQVSFSVSDGTQTVTALLTLNVLPVNDAPTALPSSATTEEDTPYLFRWSDFNIADVDDHDLAVVITALPQAGRLQLSDGSTWTAVSLGQSISRLAIESGLLRFEVEANESGYDGYLNTVLGNLGQDYAQFRFRATDGRLMSGEALFTVDVTPVADAPMLDLLPRPGTSVSPVFRTSWETVANKTLTATRVVAASLEGWSLTQRSGEDSGHDDSGTSGFTVWSSGDKMKDAKRVDRVVSAPNGHGVNWLELNDTGVSGSQTTGIQRSVATRDGASYTLSFDYAGKIGLKADFTRIGVYLDGVKLADYANTSPNTALNWQSVQVSFTGNGRARTLAIVLETTAKRTSGRSAMIDEILLTEALPLNTGYQNAPIPLSRVAASLNDTDGSESLSVVISAIPAGALISDGTLSFTATAANTSVYLSGWQRDRLSISAPQAPGLFRRDEDEAETRRFLRR